MSSFISNKLLTKLAMCCGLSILAATTRAEVTLALPFSDRMVLQRDLPVPVWGTADIGEVVTVEFGGQSQSTKADAAGKWSLKLEPLQANAEGRTFTVRGKNAITLSDVLVGEVWFCSGQSNMLVGLERIKLCVFNSQAEKERVLQRVDRELASSTLGIRLLLTSGGKPNPWRECNPDALKNQGKEIQGFSAVAYFFGKVLRAELNVPIGLIEAAVGGTRIEEWTPPEAYAAVPGFKNDLATTPLTIDGVTPGKYFRALVRRILPFSVRGVIWYQGESNVLAADDGKRYADKMRALIQSWRDDWSQPEMAFYFVQLPPMAYSKRHRQRVLTPEALPVLREGQASALQIPHTGMVVTTDLADVDDLHPANKWDVGERLARLALSQSYGRKDIECSGPVFKSAEKRGTQIVLSFDHLGGGLVCRDQKPLTCFSLAGVDHNYAPAEARIEGDTVLLSSEKVAEPQFVRFAWHEDARPNFFNKAGLPAAQFRTDDWPVARKFESKADLKESNVSGKATREKKDLTNE